MRYASQLYLQRYHQASELAQPATPRTRPHTPRRGRACESLACLLLVAAGYSVTASVNSSARQCRRAGRHAILPRIRGEALAIRAFVHFDLLRLFAPNIGRGDEEAIPYVEHFSIRSRSAGNRARGLWPRIVGDLTEAHELLRQAEPVAGRTPEELYVTQYAAAAAAGPRFELGGGDRETAERDALEALKGGFSFIREER